uniref:Uncharacterized protein n=1 Tax=Encephalitozoon cuniculi TaxID=6035 RepID=M1JJA3_ENCCN|nr:hypothetical protein ECU05_0130 [Encephalitozoon cuniculi]
METAEVKKRLGICRASLATVQIEVVSIFFTSFSAKTDHSLNTSKRLWKAPENVRVVPKAASLNMDALNFRIIARYTCIRNETMNFLKSLVLLSSRTHFLLVSSRESLISTEQKYWAKSAFKLLI